MAVIYETEKDLRQKTLDDQAKKLHDKSTGETIQALSGFGAGFIAENYNLRKAIPSRGLAWFGGLATIYGFIKMVKSFFTSRDAHNVERQLQLEGPMVSVMKLQPTSSLIEQDFNHIPDKNFTQNIQPHAPIELTTLLEHAQTVDCGGKAL